MTAKQSLISLVALSLLAGTNLYGGLVAPQSINDLQQQSDLILVGTTAGAAVSGTTVNISIVVNRVLKGDATLAGKSIGAQWESGRLNALAATGGATKESGIWFLRQTKTTTWQVVPAVQGNAELNQVYVPTASGSITSSYTYSQSAAIADKLTSELGAAIENRDGSDILLYALQIGGLDELNSPVAGQVYQRMATSTAANRKVIGLSGLIRAGNGSAIAAAASAALALSNDPSTGILVMSIRNSFRATDRDSVTAAGSVATDSSQDAVLREATAHALAAIHSVATLPFLATLLDDSNQNLRIEAIGGMAAFANGLAVQTSANVASLSYLQVPDKATYKTPETVAHLALGRQAIAPNEASYRSFWKTWWAQNRSNLGF